MQNEFAKLFASETHQLVATKRYSEAENAHAIKFETYDERIGIISLDLGYEDEQKRDKVFNELTNEQAMKTLASLVGQVDAFVS